MTSPNLTMPTGYSDNGGVPKRKKTKVRKRKREVMPGLSMYAAKKNSARRRSSDEKGWCYSVDVLICMYIYCEAGDGDAPSFSSSSWISAAASAQCEISPSWRISRRRKEEEEKKGGREEIEKDDGNQGKQLWRRRKNIHIYIYILYIFYIICKYVKS